MLLSIHLQTLYSDVAIHYYTIDNAVVCTRPHSYFASSVFKGDHVFKTSLFIGSFTAALLAALSVVCNGHINTYRQLMYLENVKHRNYLMYYLDWNLGSVHLADAEIIDNNIITIILLVKLY